MNIDNMGNPDNTYINSPNENKKKITNQYEDPYYLLYMKRLCE